MEEKKTPAVVEGVVNTSGHTQELDRTFGFWSTSSLAILVDNAWVAGCGTLVVALYNGGGPGVLYGLITATFFFIAIGACLAELASALPTSANVYHWSSVTAGRYGRVTSFFAGWFNCFTWTLGVASGCAFGSNAVIAIYAIYHPDYEFQRWHVFIVYEVLAVLESIIVLFGQRFLARASTIGGSICMFFWLVTLLTIVIMTSQTGYASNSAVWTDYQNLTGWDSSGLVFLMGVLNGAYTVGTPDSVCHMSEETRSPRVNVPWAIFMQMTTGFITTFALYIALLYGIKSLEDVQATTITSLPLAAIYQQATGSDQATVALLVLFTITIICSIPSANIIAGRMLWTLARDNAVPFSPWVRRVGNLRNPFNAQLIITIAAILLGGIFIGNATAFNAIIGVSQIFATCSFCLAILPNLLTRRKHIPPGPFWMPPIVAYPMMILACSYIIVFDIIYMFPFVYPVDPVSMNYSCVLFGGGIIFLVPWYFWKRAHGYVGPKLAFQGRDDVVHGIVGLTMAEEEKVRNAQLLGGM